MKTVNNENLIENSEQVGCACCCSIMPASVIEDYCFDFVDGIEQECTAICPLCEVDAIVTDAELGVTIPDRLVKHHHEMFCDRSCDCSKYADTIKLIAHCGPLTSSNGNPKS